MARETGAAERAKARTIGPLRGLWPFVRPYRPLLWGALAALTITAALSLSLPLAVRRVIDNFFAELLELVDAYFLAALGIAALLALGTAGRFYLVTRLGERVIADVRRAIYDRLIGMSPGFTERIMTGEVLSRLTTDTTLVLSVIGSSVSVALRNLLTLIGGLALLFWTSPKLTALVLVGVPLVVVPILTLGRRLRRLSRENQDRIAASSAEASESLAAAQTVQAYTHEAASRAVFGALTEGAYASALARIRTRALLTAIVIFLVFASIVAVLWIGARDVRAGQDDPGRAGPVRHLLGDGRRRGRRALRDLGRAAARRRRDRAHGRAAPRHRPDRGPVQPRADARPGRGAIAFEDVTFHYPARPEPAPATTQLRIPPGETVALVGPSGAGKSTIFQLLMRFFDPDAGRVTLDGIDLREVDAHRSAPPVRPGAAGAGDLRRLGAREHPLRPPGGQRRRGRGGGPRRRGARVHRPAARRATTPTSASAA